MAFDLGGTGRGVTSRMVDVQFQRVGPSLFQKPRIGEPPPGRAPIERGKNRDIDCIFHSPQVLQVLLGTQRRLRVGEVAASLGRGIAVTLGVQEGSNPLSFDFLFL